MSHWYDKDGKLHEGDTKEARKNGWVPGTTDVIHTFDNSYGLDLYKARQMFFASLTLPRQEGTTDEEFFELVKKDSEEHSEKAKQWGIDLHYVITANLNNWVHEKKSELIEKKAMEVYEWIRANKDSVIVDFKSQETKDRKFKQPYDSWLFQLCGYFLEMAYPKKPEKEYIDYSFYCETFGGTIDYAKSTKEDYKLINIMVSSNEDIPIKVYPWKPDKIEWGTQVFQKMVELYHIVKKL